jgi:thiol:disulfide interchange protein/DsbC/DsbD-like thiol-disulfide interchange protein
MTVYMIRLIALLSLFWITPIVSTETTPVVMELIAEGETIQPGKPFWVALNFQLENDWHAYWKNAGDAGIPLQIEWSLPSGFAVTEVEWPTPKQFNLGDMVGYGYEGEFSLLAEIQPSSSLPKNETVTIKANVDWLLCSSTTCLPGKSEESLSLKTSDALPLTHLKYKELFQSAREYLPKKGLSFEVKRVDSTLEIYVLDEMLMSEKCQEKEGWFVEFYPETPDHIRRTIPSSLSDNQTVILQETDNHPAKLQGILVLKRGKGAKFESHAYVVNQPIYNESAIAMNTPSISSSAHFSLAEAAPQEFEGGFALALVFAFLGGMILNLMPCVLPVISLKIMSFVKMAGENRNLVLKHGLMFSLGVVMSFWVLAGIMLILQAYGDAVGWGFQLQEPLFVGFLAALMLIVGLNMFGVFEAGLGMASWAGEKQSDAKKSSSALMSSFLSGVLATVIATPCTGPFLGSAIGFAFTLPALYALLIFTVLGLGMAFPYLILSAFPSCLRFMPKPGAWMVTFKELVGFVMMATVLWLVWIFSAQTSPIGIMMLLFALLFISMACWIYGKWSLPMTSRITRGIAYVCALAFLGLGSMIIATAASTSDTTIADATHRPSGQVSSIHDWEPFSLQRIAELQKRGTPVLVDFTAKWCLICQANHLILSQDGISSKLADKGFVKMKADSTKNDPVITQELRKFGRNGVPLYVLYGANGKTEILPQVLTADIVSNYLDLIVGR